MDPAPPADPPRTPADDGISQRKSELRRRLRARRRDVADTPARGQRDAAIVDHLIGYLDRLDAREDLHGRAGVAVYAPLPGEPGGPDLPDRLRATGRQVWLPVVTGPGRPLRWLPDLGAGHRSVGAYGIREPVAVPELTGVGSPLTLGELPDPAPVLVLPALAVDSDGTRLGQGGGFYDRTVASWTAGQSHRSRPDHGTILALVDHEEFGIPVPRTELDLTVPTVVTDLGALATGGRR